MTRTLTVMLLASAALAGCNKSDSTPDTDNAAAANNQVAEAAPVVLPPSIAASKIYRCKDNSLLYIDWLSDSVTANVRTDKAGTPEQIKTSDEGSPLKGSATAPTITYKGKSCKA